VTHLEPARLAYLRDVAGIEPADPVWIILVDLRVEFRASSSLWDQLEVGVRAERIGTKSIEFAYRIEDQDGRLVLERHRPRCLRLRT